MTKPANHELKIGELPILKIVDIEALRFHENPDDFRREKLTARLHSEKILKNPPIVARKNGDIEYIILDGANRVSALKECGLKHIVVQVVNIDDELLIIDSWHHAVEKRDRAFFEKNLENISGISLFYGEHGSAVDDEAESRIEDIKRLCTLHHSDGRSCMICSGGNLDTQVKQLGRITDLYLHDNIYDRVSYINPTHLKKHYPDFKTLVSFRNFDKHELLDLALRGIRLPAGITRVFLPKRALGLNIDMEFLKADRTLNQKNTELDEMILAMVRAKSIRFYREPTFAFDE